MMLKVTDRRNPVSKTGKGNGMVICVTYKAGRAYRSIHDLRARTHLGVSNLSFSKETDKRCDLL